MELKQHPLSAAFPSMGAEEFRAFKDDIENNGQREPILVFEGMVLDGWHRYRACVELGIKVQQFTFSGEDPADFVLSHNLHRRHLTPSQRAAAVVACAEWAPRGKPKTGTGSGLATDSEMAKKAQTSDRTIRDAKVAHKAGLGEAVKEGAITVKEAAKIARGGVDAEAPAPQAAVTPAPATKAEDFGPDDEEIKATLAAEEADRLALQKLLDSDDKLATAHAEIKRLNAVNATLQQRINGLMNEKAEAVKAAKSWQRKFRDLEKAAA